MIPYCNNYEKLIIFLKFVIKIVSYWIFTFCRFSRTLNAARVTLETFTHRTIKTTVNGGTERRNLLNCKKLRKSRISKLGDHNSVPNPEELHAWRLLYCESMQSLFYFWRKKNHDKGWEILKILNTRGWFKCYNDEMQVYMLMAGTGT